MIETFLLKEIAERALTEDLIYGDQTTEALFPRPTPAIGEVIAKEDLVVAGTDLAQIIFKIIDPGLSVVIERASGTQASKGDCILRIEGDGRAILKGERTALNFMQRLSGIATLTRRFVEGVQGTAAKIVDTRKTTPGFRILEKEAVRLGGGANHRFHLGDLILIKDNHIALVGGVTEAVKQARADLSHTLKIEVEAKTHAQVQAAVSAGVDIVMLDNMSLEKIQDAVGFIRKNAPSILIEVSGGITLDGLSDIAKSGVDLISVGALTHSAKAVDISMEIKGLPQA